MTTRFIAAIVILLCLYLIYRIRQSGKERDAQNVSQKEKPQNHSPETESILGKSRFVLPPRSNLAQTTTREEISTHGGVVAGEKADTFAPESKEIPAAIPADELDDAFRDTPAETGSDGENAEDVDPKDLDIAPDEENESPVDPEEEAEELRKVLGREADPAAGLSMEEMQEAVKAGRDPKPQDAELFQKIERTDLFEIVVAGDTDKARRITEIIDRHLREKYPEPEEENNDGDANEADGFNLEGFLGRTIKR